MDLAREKGGVKMPSDYQQKPCQKRNLVLFYKVSEIKTVLLQKLPADKFPMRGNFVP